MTVAERIASGDESARRSLEGRAQKGEWAIARSILALGSYVAALVERLDEVLPQGTRDPLPPAEPDPEPIWARVELFGHSVRYGEVVEVEFAGRRFVEIRTPELHGLAPLDEGEGFGIKFVKAATAKRYHPNAIYALEDQSEAEIRTILCRQAGLFEWEDGTWHTERDWTPVVFEPVFNEDDGA